MERWVTVEPVTSVPAPTRWPRMFIALSDPRFRRFVIGMLFTYIPMTMQMVTTGYLAYQLSGRATDLGLVALAWGVPGLLLTLVAGVIADRYQRQQILLVTQLGTALVTFVVAVLVASGLIAVWQLVLAGAVQGTLFAFNLPARQGALPEVVPERYLTNAVAVNTSFFNLCRVLGPSLAGLLIAIPAIGIAGVYALMALSFLLSALLLVRLPFGKAAAPRPRQALLREVGAGLRYLRSDPALWVPIALAFVFVGFGLPYQNLLPVYAAAVLNVDAAGLGALMTMQGVGALIGSLALGALAEFRQKGVLLLAAGLLFALLLIAVAFTAHFLLALVLLTFAGGLSNLSMSLNNTLLLLNAQREYVGRVMSISMFTFSLMPLMALPMGALADLAGLTTTFAAAGVLVIVGSALIVLLAPREAVFQER
ncbi:MAG: MFS transporter [Chloroflexi bacterium]|nr:MFS transporter [Chloroflexota bacterium]